MPSFRILKMSLPELDLYSTTMIVDELSLTWLSKGTKVTKIFVENVNTLGTWFGRRLNCKYISQSK